MKRIFTIIALVAMGMLVFTACEPLVGEDGGNKHKGHEYVDLGLPSGLKWATCNVGANSPEEYGDYFAWGEVEPKTTYNWRTYKYCDGTYINQLTKYCTESSYGKDGFTDNKIVLDLEDDAAIVNWGGAWRMPAHDEFSELKNNCTWIWITQNGVNGYKVTGPNGNSIFLPAAGGMDEDRLKKAGSGGYYWSNLLDISHWTGSRVPYRAYGVNFDLDYVYWYGNFRSIGLSVRPVCP